MSIRVAVTGDIKAMHRVRMSVTENRLSDPTSIGPEDYRLMLTERGRGWVYELKGRIVGFAVGDLIGRNVWALFVDPGFERRGIGRKLHTAMMSWMFSSGAMTVWLGTGPGTRAEGFYRSAGWRQVNGGSKGEVRYEMSRDVWTAAAPEKTLG